MTSDIYLAPKADLDENGEAVNHEFYVVSGPKFLALMIGTFGWYEIYWFYRHWKNYSVRHNQSMWPVIRSIISIFFAYSLFKKIEVSLSLSDKKYQWRPGLLAIFYIIASLAARTVDQLPVTEQTLLIMLAISIGLFSIYVWSLYRVQLAANIACDDPNGSRNANFTLANCIWLLMGILLWIFILFGAYVGATGADLNLNQWF